jgi:hypothetical protein
MRNPEFPSIGLCSDDFAVEGKAKIQRRRKNAKKAAIDGLFENRGVFNLIVL